MPVSVKMVKAPDPELPFYDFEEFEQLVEGAGKAGADVLAFVLLAGEAGLRRGEIIALERSDIDFKRNQITVRQSDWQGQIDTPKSGKTRRVPMTARLAVALQAIRHLRGPRAFYQRNGKLISAKHAAKLDAASSSPRWAATDQRRPHPAPHLLLAPCDARRAGPGHSGAGRTHQPQHHDALHAPVPRVAQPGHPAARAAAAAPGRAGGEWYPSAGKHEQFPVERWRPHRDSNYSPVSNRLRASL